MEDDLPIAKGHASIAEFCNKGTVLQSPASGGFKHEDEYVTLDNCYRNSVHNLCEQP